MSTPLWGRCRLGRRDSHILMGGPASIRERRFPHPYGAREEVFTFLWEGQRLLEREDFPHPYESPTSLGSDLICNSSKPTTSRYYPLWPATYRRQPRNLKTRLLRKDFHYKECFVLLSNRFEISHIHVLLCNHTPQCDCSMHSYSPDFNLF